MVKKDLWSKCTAATQDKLSHQQGKAISHFAAIFFLKAQTLLAKFCGERLLLNKARKTQFDLT